MLPFLSLQGPLHIKKFQRNMKLFLYNKLKIEFQNLTFESLNNGKTIGLKIVVSLNYLIPPTFLEQHNNLPLIISLMHVKGRL